MSKIYPSFWYLTPFHSIGWYLAVLILCAIIRDTDNYWLGQFIAVDWYANLWLLPIVDRWPFHFGLWFYHVRLHACLLPMVHLLVKHIVMIGCAQHHRKCLSQKARPNSCLLLTTHGAALKFAGTSIRWKDERRMESEGHEIEDTFFLSIISLS